LSPGCHERLVETWEEKLRANQLSREIVTGDGNCLYHCIKKALELDDLTVKEMRKFLVGASKLKINDLWE